MRNFNSSPDEIYSKKWNLKKLNEEDIAKRKIEKPFLIYKISKSYMISVAFNYLIF